MYHPANYYAARTAAIKEALEDQRMRSAAAAKQPQTVPTLQSAEALRHCGEKMQLTLGYQWGDLAGTVVDGVYCYSISNHFFVAKFRDPAAEPMQAKTYIVSVCSYSTKDDIYNKVISVEAVI